MEQKLNSELIGLGLLWLQLAISLCKNLHTILCFLYKLQGPQFLIFKSAERKVKYSLTYWELGSNPKYWNLAKHVVYTLKNGILMVAAIVNEFDSSKEKTI